MRSSKEFANHDTVSESADGRAEIQQNGFSYLPHFITKEESKHLIAYFAGLMPIWEQRHAGDERGRSPNHPRRLTRPVYWLGAWQFASLGYYAEPDHREDRCLRAEGFPAVMQGVLDRLRPLLCESHEDDCASPDLVSLPNTCLINYYGREIGESGPRDYARLRMHRDGEPGPVVMFNVGQAGLLEFLDPDRSADPELSVWTRHRSVTILSGADFKDRLYHRIVQVRTGNHPPMTTRLEAFDLRRVSISFRYVPEDLISDFADFPEPKRTQVKPYVEQLAQHSPHFRNQL
ncbi:MAG: alkylated DNA repair protein (DNA oxidative demethylase) [Hyphomicrobiaceae bacterium]